MIRLKQLLREMEEVDIQRCLDKIRNKQYSFIAAGDNGKVYEINGEDKVFKITTESAEFEVAQELVGKTSLISSFIPVYYTNDKNMYIMANAGTLPDAIKQKIDSFHERYKQYARSVGGDASIFDYLDDDGARDTDPQVVTFLRALQNDVRRLGIEDLDLDLDFKTDNIMTWNGKLVMVDW